MTFTVPILLISFNRPGHTSQVLSVLRNIRPQVLYLACDGPRPNNPTDFAKCESVRNLLQRPAGGVGAIDWPCRIEYLFQPSNLGCRRAVTSAINWFFDHESEGIILEDDILPHSSFFFFCQELLERYRYDERIGVIAANNHQRKPPSDGSSYRFSIYSHCWGWATWRRAWQLHDNSMPAWPEFRSQRWLNQLGDENFSRRWLILLTSVYEGRVDTWDIPWQLTCWQQGFLTIIPSYELVENIGFSSDATHTLDQKSPLGARSSVLFPLVHPTIIQADRLRDADTFRRLYKLNLLDILKVKLRKLVRIVTHS